MGCVGKTWLMLYKPNQDTFIQFKFRYNDPGSIFSEDIETLYEDRNGNLWLGGQGKSGMFSPFKMLSFILGTR